MPALDQREWNFKGITDLHELRTCQNYEYARESRTIRGIIERFRKDPESFDVDRNPISPNGGPLTVEGIEAAVQMQSFGPARIAGFPRKPFLALSPKEKAELLRGTSYISGGEMSHSLHGFQPTYGKIVTSEDHERREEFFKTSGVYLDWVALNLNYPDKRILGDLQVFLNELRRRRPGGGRPRILEPYRLAGLRGTGKRVTVEAGLERLGVARLLQVHRAGEARRIVRDAGLIDAFRTCADEDSAWHTAFAAFVEDFPRFFSIAEALDERPLCADRPPERRSRRK